MRPFTFRRLLLLTAVLVGAGCAGTKNANMHRNRVIAETGLSDAGAFQATSNALRDAGFEVSRHAREMGMLRTEWTELIGYDTQIQVWADVNQGDVKLRGWYRRRGADEKVVTSPGVGDLGQTAWQVMERVARDLPGPISYDYDVGE